MMHTSQCKAKRECSPRVNDNDKKKEEEEEEVANAFICSICQRIFKDPVSITCGHTFCRSCLTAHVDYASVRHYQEDREQVINVPTDTALRRETRTASPCHCPLCRAPIHIDSRTHPSSVTVAAMVQTMYPIALEGRVREDAELQLLKKSSDADHTAISLPLFVLGSLAPGMKLRLKIFEPRYRLMMRRVLEGSSVFGLAPRRNDTDARELPGSWGTACKITESTTLADGQMVIVCKGLYRFQTGDVSHLDAYCVGSCTRYHDDSIHDLETLSSLEKTLKPILAHLKWMSAEKKFGMEPTPDSLTFDAAENRSAAERHSMLETVSLLLAGHARCTGKFLRDTDTKTRVENVVSVTKKWFPSDSNKEGKEGCCVM